AFGVDPEPFQLQQSTRAPARIFGVYDEGSDDEYYEQDLTFQLIVDQLEAIAESVDSDDEPNFVLESQDP
ncbi:MAG: hypothetical protein ACPHER_08620, partial [Nevskiales bacterium]